MSMIAADPRISGQAIAGSSRAGTPRREAFAMLGVIALTVIAYLPVINAGLIWDDDYHIAKKALHSMNGLWAIWSDPRATQQYYPLAHTGFWVQYMLWGERPMGYHIVNVALHCINVVLLWRLLKLLHMRGAILAAAIFAVHPVNVESVAWITELKNTLCGFFSLSAVIFYFRFDPPGPERVLDEALPREAITRRAWGFYFMAVMAYVAALLSKTVAATLPAALLVIIWWKRGRLTRRDVLPTLPMFLVGAMMGALTIHFEKHIWGAQGDVFNFTFVERTLIAGRAVWFYAWKLIWPTNLAFFYSRWPIATGQWWQYLFPITAAALPVCLWMLRRRVGRGPLAACLLFGGTLFPALGYFNLYWQVYTFVCDHMLYMACISIISLLASVVVMAAPKRRPAEMAIHCAAAGLVCALAWLSWRQAHIYKNLETLYRDTIAKSPDSWLSHYNLGVELQSQGRVDEAANLYRHTIEINPMYEDAIYNLGNILYERGQVDDAIIQYRRAIEIRGNMANAHHNLANALRDQGKLDEAADEYRQAAKLDPQFEEPLINLGIILAEQGKLSEAAVVYTEAMRRNPDNAAVRVNLAINHLQRGMTDQASTEMRKALHIQPELAARVTAAGEKLLGLGKPRDALVLFNAVLEINPNDAAAQRGRDRASMSMGGWGGSP